MGLAFYLDETQGFEKLKSRFSKVAFRLGKTQGFWKNNLKNEKSKISEDVESEFRKVAFRVDETHKIKAGVEQLVPERFLKWGLAKPHFLHTCFTVD